MSTRGTWAPHVLRLAVCAVLGAVAGASIAFVEPKSAALMLAWSAGLAIAVIGRFPVGWLAAFAGSVPPTLVLADLAAALSPTVALDPFLRNLMVVVRLGLIAAVLAIPWVAARLVRRWAGAHATRALVAAVVVLALLALATGPYAELPRRSDANPGDPTPAPEAPWETPGG